jgi:hypothetical protein
MTVEIQSQWLGERASTRPVARSPGWLSSVLSVGVTLVFLTHTLRNLTPLYVVVLGLTYAVGLACLIGAVRLPRGQLPIIGLYAAFLVYSTYVAGRSVSYLGRVDILDSIARLYIAPLLPAVLYPFYRSEADGWRLTRLYVFIFTVAVATYGYQFVAGPVAWFNEPGAPRGGLLRFSTNLGSLTIYGTAVGVALLYVFATRTNIWFKATLTCLLLAGCAFSLQKAAFVNVGLAAIGGLWIAGWRARFKALVVVSLGLLLLLGGGSRLLGPELARYVDALSVNTIGVSVFNSDVRKDDAISSKRVTERAYSMVADEILIEHDSLVAFTLGLGVIGGGGGMGMSAPQAHNSLWDLLLMGGLGYLAVFLLLYFIVQRALWRRGGSFARMLFAANIIFLINAAASSAHMFHPITSFPFWLSLVVVIRGNKMHPHHTL